MEGSQTIEARLSDGMACFGPGNGMLSAWQPQLHNEQETFKKTSTRWTIQNSHRLSVTVLPIASFDTIHANRHQYTLKGCLNSEAFGGVGFGGDMSGDLVVGGEGTFLVSERSPDLGEIMIYFWNSVTTNQHLTMLWATAPLLVECDVC